MKSLMWKSIVGGFAACCAMSPFLSVAVADDKEMDIQPDWRWQEPRNRDDDTDWNDRNRDDADWDRDGDGRGVLLRGVVTRSFLNDRFEIRTDDGLVYRVIPDAAQERFVVRVGERVRVRGRVDGSTFLAQRVEFDRSVDRRDDRRDGGWRDDGDRRDDGGWRDTPRDRNDEGNREVNFPATVESRESSHRLTVRGDNGRLYILESRTNLPQNISTGSRVRVQGSAVGNQVRLQRVIAINDGLRGEQYVNFRGTVEGVEDFNRLRVRADNGRTYTIRSQNALNIERGDRVRVRGNYARGLITASSIERV